MPLSLDLYSHGIFRNFDILLVFGDLKSVTLLDVLLTLCKGTPLVFDCADQDLASTLLDDDQVLGIKECDLSGRWHENFENLLARYLVIDLKDSAVEYCNFPLARIG